MSKIFSVLRWATLKMVVWATKKKLVKISFLVSRFCWFFIFWDMISINITCLLIIFK